MPYLLRMADHFHYMREEENYDLDRYESAAEAVAEARRQVDDCLLHMHKPGMGAAEVWQLYTMFGDDPYVLAEGGAPAVDFHAWDYARQRAGELTGRLGRLRRWLARKRRA
jgi:hypothetical protein